MPDFEEIYQTYFADVYRYILALSRDAHTAEEVTQETFFRFCHFEHRPSHIISPFFICDAHSTITMVSKHASFTYNLVYTLH